MSTKLAQLMQLDSMLANCGRLLKLRSEEFIVIAPSSERLTSINHSLKLSSQMLCHLCLVVCAEEAEALSNLHYTSNKFSNQECLVY